MAEDDLTAAVAKLQRHVEEVERQNAELLERVRAAARPPSLAERRAETNRRLASGVSGSHEDAVAKRRRRRLQSEEETDE